MTALDREHLELHPDDDPELDERQREIDGYIDRYYRTGRWDWERDDPEPRLPQHPGVWLRPRTPIGRWALVVVALVLAVALLVVVGAVR